MADGGGRDAGSRHRLLAALATAEGTLHSIEVLGCAFSATWALARSDVSLAAWSLTALLTSAAALLLMHRRRDMNARTPLRNGLYAVMRLHRACAIMGLHRAGGVLSPVQHGPGGAAADRVHFAKAVLVNSSILPILLQALVLLLPLGMQAAVQVAVASIALRAMPRFCAALHANGVRQEQFAWLARLQGRLSSVVMAATSGSRGSIAYDAVPCTALLSHLVLVFEVLVPVLFAFYVDRACAAWLGGLAEAGAANGAASPRSAGAAGAGSGGTGGSVGAGVRSPPRQLVATWPSAADSTDGGLAAAAARRLDAQRAGQARQPPALLMLLLGLGLSGVLFDVVLTYTSRGAAAAR